MSEVKVSLVTWWCCKCMLPVEVTGRCCGRAPVAPMYDDRLQHIGSVDCWCQPEVESYEHGDVIIHRDNQ
jgi:hypothetical protein